MLTPLRFGQHRQRLRSTIQDRSDGQPFVTVSSNRWGRRPGSILSMQHPGGFGYPASNGPALKPPAPSLVPASPLRGQALWQFDPPGV